LNLAAPAFLGALALGLPLVVLYLIKLKRRPVTVGYLRLWDELVVESRARSLFEKLKRWLSLLLQLAILALLVLALSEPTREARSSDARQTVLILDASASMQVREADGRTRFELALEEAQREIAARRGDDRIMLVAASDRIEVLSPFEQSGLRLREALGRAEVSNRRLGAERALAFAHQVTRNQPNPRILVLSDGAAGELARAQAAQALRSSKQGDAKQGDAKQGDAKQGEKPPVFELRCLGDASENVGVLRFAARKNTSQGTDYVLAVVKNFGTEARDVRMELSLNGATHKVLPRSLKPGQVLTERFQLTLPEGGTLELRLAGGESDALSIDDVAYAVVRPTRLRKVLLVCPREEQLLAFRIAFQAMKEVVDPSSQALTEQEYEALSDEDRSADVTLCLQRLPKSLPSRGNLFLIDTPLPASLPATRAEEPESAPKVWDWEREHLLNRYLDWRDLPLPPARTLRLSGGEALVSSYEGALVAAFQDGGRRVVHVSFDLSSGLFPFRLAFPMLLRNAIAWFELSQDLLLRPSYAPGEVISPMRPMAGPSVTARHFLPGASEATRSELSLREGRFYFTATDTPGPVVFEAGDTIHTTCVNLFAPDESSIAPTPSEDAAASDPARRSAISSELWPWAALLALLVWTLEWGTYHRRWTE
jgi:hypothetical protein